MTAAMLLTSGAVIVSSLLFSKLSSRIGVPALLAFIVLGMLFGSDGIFKIPFEDYAFAEDVCVTALIFIMFYGGFGTKWSAAKPVALPSVALSSAGVIMTAVLTGLFCRFVFGLDIIEGMLIGAVLSSTDAASVFAVLRHSKLSLKYGTDSMLELESGSNDPFSYMLTLLLIEFAGKDLSAGYIALTVLREISVGALCGAAAAFAAKLFLQKYSFEADGSASVFMIAAALIGYALPAALGGNGFLSVYIVGLILGNSRLPGKKPLVNFFDGLTGLMQIAVFFLLGLLSTPSAIPGTLALSAGVFLFLLLIARPVSAAAILLPFGAKLNQIALVSWAGLRGAASVVFAIFVTMSGISTGSDVFHVTLTVVLLSIAVQGTLLPFMAKKLGMIDESGDVMKTFSDYSDDEDIQFIRLDIGSGHSWAGKSVKELSLIPGMLLVLIRRGENAILPNGGTVVEEGDVAVLSASGYRSRGDSIKMREIEITPHHKWNNTAVSELNLKRGTLLLMIRRGGGTIIPRGDTVIRENDIVIEGTI